jgi:uncharacterized protein (TIGR02246 family)
VTTAFRTTQSAPFEAVTDIAHALVGAHNAKDARALADLFTEDAEFVNIFGGRQNGRDAIEAGHAAAFDGPLANIHLEIEGVETRPLAETVMLAQVSWRRSVVDGGAPQVLGPGSGLFTMVLSRDTGDDWRIAVLTNVQDAQRGT